MTPVQKLYTEKQERDEMRRRLALIEAMTRPDRTVSFDDALNIIADVWNIAKGRIQ